MIALLMFCGLAAWNALRCETALEKREWPRAGASALLFLFFAGLVAAQWIVMRGGA